MSLTIFAADFHAVGDIRSPGEIHIDGIVNGNVTAGKITIGQSGTVIGSLEAPEILVCGTVHGTLFADSVHLSRTARVHGALLQGELVCEEGAVFEPADAAEAAADI